MNHPSSNPLWLNVFLAVVMALAVALWVGILWTERGRSAYRRWRFKRDDQALRRLTNHTDYLHDLFGPKVAMRSISRADGTYEIYLECPECHRENRLKKGFVGAICSDCKAPFVKPVVLRRSETWFN